LVADIGKGRGGYKVVKDVGTFGEGGKPVDRLGRGLNNVVGI
jgi:hypothetical protein